MSISELDVQEWRQSEVTRRVIKIVEEKAEGDAVHLVLSAGQMNADQLQRRAVEIAAVMQLTAALKEVEASDLL